MKVCGQIGPWIDSNSAKEVIPSTASGLASVPMKSRSFAISKAG